MTRTCNVLEVHLAAYAARAAATAMCGVHRQVATGGTGPTGLTYGWLVCPMCSGRDTAGMRADKVLTGKTGENGQHSRRRARAPWTRPSVRRFALGVYERACRDGSLSTGSPVGHSTRWSCLSRGLMYSQAITSCRRGEVAPRLRVVLAVIVPTEKEGTGSRWGACAPVFGCDRRRAEGPLRTYVAIRTSHQSPGLFRAGASGGLAVFAQLCCLLA